MRALVENELLAPEAVEPLRRMRDINVLLYDFVLKRTDKSCKWRTKLFVVTEPRTTRTHVTGNSKVRPVIEFFLHEGAYGMRHRTKRVADEVDEVGPHGGQRESCAERRKCVGRIERAGEVSIVR